MIEIAQQLTDVCRGAVLLLGVGNAERGDDGAGPAVIARLSGRTSATCIDAGTTPENYLEKIVAAAPDTVIIADAADFDGAPGEARVFDAEAIGTGGLSTHALSLGMAQGYLKNRIPAARLYLLAIQPARTDADGLSPPVEAGCAAAARAIVELLPPAGNAP